ncbi:MAG: hypothetical protein WCI74_09545 [Actinomycetes bacterium]
MTPKSRRGHLTAVSLALACAASVLWLSPAEAMGATPAAATPAVARAAKAALTFSSSAAVYGTRNSPSVRNLQKLLIRKKFATRGLRSAGATGSYLRQTKLSVKKLQRSLGYAGADADGIIGRSSAAKLGLVWVSSTPVTPLQVPPSPTTPPTGVRPIDPALPAVRVPALSATALKSVLQQAGFTEPSIRTAWALAMRESGGHPAIVGPANSNGTHDYGLFQINDVHRATTDFRNIYNPLFNASVAFRLSSGGQDFGAWGIGDTGWAGQLHKSSPALWTQLQNQMLSWRAKYPG